jgi:hypothetical protein
VRLLRWYIDWERRWGLPINRLSAAFSERLFVVLGPAAIGLGLYFVVSGYWIGLVMVAAGGGMTLMGWAWLVRAVRSRL